MRRRRSPIAIALAAPLLLAAMLGACANDDSSRAAGDERLRIGVALYPIEEIVRAVGGDLVDVIALVPPGQEAHVYEPSPQQIGRIENVDVVFYLARDFQPNVEKALASLPARVQRVDLLDGLTILPIDDTLAGTEGEVGGETLGDGGDPHVWLDPTNMVTMTEHVRAVLGDAAPTLAATFDANAAAYTGVLDALDRSFTDGLSSCAAPVIVTTHRAFGYLAQRYGLTQLPIAGISPDEEPSAKTLEEVATAAAELGVRTIFSEENLPPDLSRTVAAEIGATTDVLDTVETLSEEQLDAGETYVSVMEANLAALRRGLGCR